jgi:F-type H+-transporting ATPase subunit a
VLPVVVGVLFTVLHAIIQAYVLTMLTSVYYGEVSEVHEKKAKEPKKKKSKKSEAEAQAA